MNFILYYQCVPYANDAVFSLGSGRLCAPMCAKGSCLILAKFSKQVNLEPVSQHLEGLLGLKLNDKSFFFAKTLTIQ